MIIYKTWHHVIELQKVRVREYKSSMTLGERLCVWNAKNKDNIIRACENGVLGRIFGNDCDVVD
jgi:hypothetical protein